MIVRRATPHDSERIVELGERFFATTSYAKFAGYDETSAAVLVQMMRESGVLLVAEVNDVIVGMVGLMVAPFLFNHALRSAHEVMWYVDPDARDSGAGVALLRAVEPACREAGCVIVQMLKLANSPPAADVLYARCGYVETETCYSKVL